MSLFKNWFSKPEVEVPDLEEIVVKPEIVIPEKTRRELYDAAVLEVQSKRVQMLILIDLQKKATDPEVYKQTIAAREQFGTTIDEGVVEAVKEAFPKANIENEMYPYGSAQRIILPEVNLHSLAHELAKDYLSE
ncbi:hypothetical protein VPHD148_0326 [Vibrio phage D148]